MTAPGGGIDVSKAEKNACLRYLQIKPSAAASSEGHAMDIPCVQCLLTEMALQRRLRNRCGHVSPSTRRVLARPRWR